METAGWNRRQLLALYCRSFRMVKLAVGALLAACSFHLLNKTSNTFHRGIWSLLILRCVFWWNSMSVGYIVTSGYYFGCPGCCSFCSQYSYVFIGIRCFNPASVRFSAVFATQVFLRHQIETSVNCRGNSSLGGSPGRCGSGVSQVPFRPALRARKNPHSLNLNTLIWLRY